MANPLAVNIVLLTGELKNGKKIHNQRLWRNNVN